MTSSGEHLRPSSAAGLGLERRLILLPATLFLPTVVVFLACRNVISLAIYDLYRRPAGGVLVPPAADHDI